MADMSRRASFLICLVAVAAFSMAALADAVVTFPDPGLEAAIREAIVKPTGDILESDLVGLTTLDAASRAISDLTGIEHCASLQSLDLSFNQISDLASLSGLTALTTLDLSDNQSSNLAPLAGLTALTRLGLWSNQISNLAPLAELTALTELYLGMNQIINLAPLAELTALTTLYLGGNQINNLGPLATLTALTSLNLWSNRISDLAPLSGLTALTDLILDNNYQISNLAPLSGLTALTSLYLSDNQIGNLAPLAGLTALTSLFLSDNQITDLGPLLVNSGMDSGDWVDVRWNYLCIGSSSEEDLPDINALLARGVSVSYDPQTDYVCDSAAVFRVTKTGIVQADSNFYGSSFKTGAADVAEWVQVTGLVGAGDVLELDPSLGQSYRLAQAPCSDLIAGVVSTQPGVTLGAGTLGPQQALLALSGIVPVKVTNEGGPIQPGDLLVSSSTPGYAMRWAGDGPCPCAVVGKALQPMTDGSGTISVLLTAH